MSIFTDDKGIDRDESTNNPVCKRCNLPIDNPELHFISKDPRHPDIKMGPYHQECWPYVKVCTSCHTPHMIDDESSIKHLGSGVWLCTECQDKVESCESCGNDDVLKESPSGRKLCTKCFFKHYMECNVLGSVQNRWDVPELELKRYVDLFNSYPKNSISEAGFDSIKSQYTPLNLECCPDCSKIEALQPPPAGISGHNVCSVCWDLAYIESCSFSGNPGTRGSYSELDLARYPSIFSEYDSNLLSVESFITLRKDVIPEVLYECNRCSELTSESDKYCKACKDSGYVSTCTMCGSSYHKSSLYRGLCEDCEKKVEVSFHSGDTGLRKSMLKFRTLIGPKYYLKEEAEEIKKRKYMECPTCHDVVEKSMLVKRGSITHCAKCESKLRVCGRCGKPHLGEADCRKKSSEFISNYSWKPIPIFHTTPKELSRFKKGVFDSPIFMGFENEMAFVDERKMYKSLGNIYSRYDVTQLYVKSDSSINGAGFEIVSHPFTLSSLKKLPLSYIFRYKQRDGNTKCGMHVHISRSTFRNKLHIYRFINLINSSKSKKVMKRIAGRYDVNYSSKMDDKETASRIKDDNVRRNTFVNLCNKETVEVRIFKNAMNRKELYYRVEFVEAAAVFTMDSSLSDGMNDFLIFVKENKKRYHYLSSFLEL